MAQNPTYVYPLRLLAAILIGTLLAGCQPIRPVVETPAAESDYSAEDVTFGHDDIMLAGTLTLPDTVGPHPAVILISGSGQQDRNEAIPIVPDYKPFEAIADHLSRQGIAVLRYDDRGFGESTGDASMATSADFALDTEAALAHYRVAQRSTPSDRGCWATAKAR